MIEKKPIYPSRIRKITGSFAFIEHRFLKNGFFADLNHHELLLYILLILVSDRNGLSYYGYDKICTLLRITLDDYLLARNALIDKDLIAFDGYFFQVLSLPQKTFDEPVQLLKNRDDMEKNDPATITNLICQSLNGGKT